MREMRWVAWIGLISLAACGGGGAAGDPPVTLPLPTGRVEGRVNFIRAVNPIALDQEPNDTVDSAQQLADGFAGDTRSAFGRLDVPGGDVIDAYRMRIPQRARVHVQLKYATIGRDFALSLYDPISMQVVGNATNSTPQFEFSYQGTLDFLVTGLSGAGSYNLSFNISAPFIPAPESEPNNNAQTADLVGEVPIGQTAEVNGEAYALGDNVDAFLVIAPDTTVLSFLLVQPEDADMVVRVSDVTSGLGSPNELLLMDGPVSAPRAGTLAVSAGTLLLVVVEAEDEGGNWQLAITGVPPGSLKPFGQEPVTAPAPQIAALSAESLPVATQYGRCAGEAAAGQALVQFCEGQAAQGEAMLHARRCRVVDDVPGVFCHVDFALTSVPSEQARETIARTCLLASSPCVEIAEPNHIRRIFSTTPDDTDFARQWNLDMVNMPNAWDIETGDNSVIIAVLDTGKTPHPDLVSRWYGGYDFINEVPRAGDGDGRDADASDVGRTPNFFGSYIFHGTYVAGIAGATTNNTNGIAGVDWDARIMPIRVSGISFNILEADLINAIRYAAGLSNVSGETPTQRADIINMSLGSPSWGHLLDGACHEAKGEGVTIIAAAGNSDNDVPNYPAASSATISVSAVDAARERAFYSSYGDTITIAAPGGDTTADVNGDGLDDGVYSTHVEWSQLSGQPVVVTYTYASFNGTSASAPHVAGIAALLLAQNGSRTPDQIESILISTAFDLGPIGRDDEFGFGLVDARAALALEGPGTPTPPELQLDPEALNFGFARESMTAIIRNGGTTFLDVTSVEVTTDGGQPWLLVQTQGAGSAVQSADALLLQVDRDALSVGTYFGQVVVRSNGGDVTLPVSMQVVGSLPAPPNLEITVRALNAETGAFVQEQSVNPARTLDFVFASLPIGEYVFVASSDVDVDGQGCEGGDYCGGFPLRTAPQTVRVIRGITSSGVNFDVVRNNTGAR